MKERLSTIQMLELMGGKTLTVREIIALAAEKYPDADANPKHLNRKLKTLQMSPTVQIERERRDVLTAYRVTSVSQIFKNRSAGATTQRKAVATGRKISRPYVSQLNEEERQSVEQVAMFNQLLAGVRERVTPQSI